MSESKEIDILAIIGKVLKKPKLLAANLVVFLVIGIVAALNTPKIYTASVVLAPEVSSGIGVGSGLADMAADFGIDVSSMGKEMDAIYPEVYPEILSSNDFVSSLFDVPVRTVKSDSIRTYLHHMTKDMIIPFWEYPKIWLTKKLLKEKTPASGGKGKKDKFIISRDESELCKGIVGNISCLVDKKTSVITISVKDQDALVCAIMADTIQQRLQAYITAYRTKKARTDCQYYKQLFSEAKVKYDKAQKEYADFCDANQDVVLESYKVKRDELENKMQITFNNMNQQNSQVLLAEAKIQERTPAFTILSEAKMQYKATSTPRAFIVLIYLFLGCCLDLIVVLYLERRINKNKKQTPSVTTEA